jgi:hypothetical protein
LINNVLKIATYRFGPPSSEMCTAIESVVEIVRLEQLLEFSFKCNNWNQLIASPNE